MVWTVKCSAPSVRAKEANSLAVVSAPGMTITLGPSPTVKNPICDPSLDLTLPVTL
jgi:hypothetical protein